MSDFEKLPEIFNRLRRIDPGIPVPRGLPHLSEFADEVENLEKKYFRFLWNIKNRTECNDDALYIGIILSVLKRQGNAHVIKDSLKLVDMMEKAYNTYRTTKQWCFDSSFRFFPAIEDDIFGYRLSDEDLCINKVLTFGSRGEARDYIDVCQMLKDNKPVLAFVFAACEIDPGYVPQTLINAMDFNIRKAYIDWDKVKGNSFSKQQARMLFQDFKQFYYENINNVSLTDGFGLFLDPDTGKAFWPTKEDIASGRYILHHGKNYGNIPQLRTNASPAP